MVLKLRGEHVPSVEQKLSAGDPHTIWNEWKLLTGNLKENDACERYVLFFAVCVIAIDAPLASDDLAGRQKNDREHYRLAPWVTGS